MGWRYYTREEYADLITRYVAEGQQSKLSQAALETLAVVAYTQPISRGRVSAVRGVNVDGVMRTLLARGLIEEAGHDQRVRRCAVRHHQLLPGTDGAEGAAMICRRLLRSCPRWRNWRPSSASWRGTDELGGADPSRSRRTPSRTQSRSRSRLSDRACSRAYASRRSWPQPESPLAGHAKS